MKYDEMVALVEDGRRLRTVRTRANIVSYCRRMMAEATLRLSQKTSPAERIAAAAQYLSTSLVSPTCMPRRLKTPAHQPPS